MAQFGSSGGMELDKPLIVAARALRRRLAVLIVALALGLGLTPGAARAEDSAKSLAAAFDSLVQAMDGQSGPADQDRAYQAMRLLDRIVAEFPDTLEARLLREKGRLPHRKTDLAALYLLARQWEDAHPELPRSAPVHPSIALAEMADSGSSLVIDEPPAKPPAAPALPLAGALEKLRPGTAAPAAAARVAPGQSKNALLAHLRAATVLLYFVGEGKNGGLVAVHVGTGSFIGPDLVLTNAHVASAMGGYSGTWLALNEKIGVRPLRLVSMAPHDTAMKIDAAVMRVDGYASDTWLNFNTDPALDDPISIAGYPGDAAMLDIRYRALNEALQMGQLPDLTNLPTALVNEGRINNFIANAESNAMELQYTMVTAPGNSGSPVVNGCGEIVGLHYSGGAKAAEIKFNGAVHARDVVTYLGLVGVKPSLAPAPCDPGN